MRPPVRMNREHDFGVMTPMIDIVFLLLVFFVIGAAGQVPEALLPTELSATGGITSDIIPPAPPPLTIEVFLKLSVEAESGETVIDMNGTLYREFEKLKSQLLALAEIAPDSPIILDIDDRVPMEDVIKVYDTCQSANFKTVDFALDLAQ